MSRWNGSDQNISVSDNVGVYQLQDKNFFSKLEMSLSNHSNVHPSQFEMEILETSALTDIAQVSALIKKMPKLRGGFFTR